MYTILQLFNLRPTPRLFTLSVAITLSIVTSGCGASPRRSSGVERTRTGVSPTFQEVSRDTLNKLDQVLREQNLTLVGPAIHGELPEFGMVVHAVSAVPRVCYLFVGLTKPAGDLNIIVTGPDGSTIGHDVQPNPHPWVYVCPGKTGRLTARLQMVTGSGDYYYAVYQGSSREQPELASFFGEQPLYTEAHVVPSTEATQRIDAIDRKLKEASFNRVDAPRGTQIQEHESREFALHLREGQCYAFAVALDQGVRAVELSLTDTESKALNTLQSSNSHPKELRHCAAEDGVHTLKTRGVEGSGAVFVLAYAGEGDADNQETIMEARSRESAGAAEKFRLMDADMRARGYAPFGDTEKESLRNGDKHSYKLSFESGKCYAVVAVGDEGVEDLDLSVTSAGGAIFDRDLESSAQPVVRVCPERKGDYVVHVTMKKGAGKFTYTAYRWRRGTHGPFGLTGLLYVRLAEVTALLGDEGFSPDPSYPLGRGSLRRQGDEEEHSLSLRADRCYAVLVVGGKGISDLALNLSEETEGNSLAKDKDATPFPHVRYCPKDQGSFRLKIESSVGAGDYVYQIFYRG